MKNNIRIPLSKNKMFLLLIMASLFVFLGMWLAIDPEKFANTVSRNRPPILVQIVGIVTILFFGICSVLFSKKLFDKKDGLIIDKNGITDNSGGTSIGLIPWNDITGFRVTQVHSQKFLTIDVTNPKKYIELQKSKIAKLAMRANNKRYGSPISISANALKCNFEELHHLMAEQFEIYAQQKQF